MPSRDYDMDRTPNGKDDKETLEFYKSQIETLENELAEFQASSRELEQELEKELEASEKQHRDLKHKNEQLRYEVEEWKNKYKQSKQESNAAQNALQKEITTLREQNRHLTLKLRDIEVANDDLERQERINKSSLDDYESKYSQAIEREVLLEAEIQMGDQEREQLRVECQRLRDELSDLRVEVDIAHDKLAKAERNKYTRRQDVYSDGHASLSTSPTTPTTISSLGSKHTPHSISSPAPPSPPISEASTTPSISGKSVDPSTTPRPSHYQRPFRHSRGTSLASSNGSSLPLPPSRSLHQIRGLIGQMQRLEQRVQSARSKLPQASYTPPSRGSPTSSSAGGYIPSSITVRSRRTPRPGSTMSNSSVDTATSGISRLSFGTGHSIDRPQSRTSYIPERPLSRVSISRPESRCSTSSRASMGQSSIPTPARPASRASASANGRSTPVSVADSRVPRSARPSASSYSNPQDDDIFTSTPVRRSTLPKNDVGVPAGYRSITPSATTSAIPRRSFGRTSVGKDDELGVPTRRVTSPVNGSMLPPPSSIHRNLRHKKALKADA